MRVALEDIAEINPAPPRGLPGSETVAFVPMASVSETGSMRVLEHKLVSELNGGYSNFRSGDILLAKITPCFENNKLALADIDTDHGFGSTEFHVIRAHTSVLDSRYLINFLRQDSVREAGTRRMTGSAGQKRVPRLFLANLMVPLPPINEQRRIAAILDLADDLRRKRRLALERLTELPQAIFRDMFGDPIENPNGHPTVALEMLIDDTRGISYGIVQRGLDQSRGVSVLRISDLEDGRINTAALKKTTAAIAAKHKRTKLHGGEIVISIRGTIGRCALVPIALAGSNVSRELAVLPLISSTRSSEFLLNLLRAEPVQRRLTRDVKGVAQSGINLADLRKLPIIQPPPELVSTFVALLTKQRGLAEKSKAHLERCELLFASLQHCAFEGTVAPTSVEAALASV
jgi:type I restriction enzyme, S subunit